MALGRFAALAFIACLASYGASASDYPTSRITVVVPFPAGALTDVLGRLVADRIREETGQAVIVENRPGAAGNVGIDVVAKSKPDGYTLGLVGNNTLVVNPHLYKVMPFDPVKDLTLVGLVGEVPQVIAINPNVPVKNMAEFLELARKTPGRYTYASAGTGSPSHLNVFRWSKIAGIELTHVPYRGIAPALMDVLSHQVDILEAGLSTFQAHAEAGKIRILGVDGFARLPSLPDTQTLSELLPISGIDAKVWFGLVAPAATPAPIVNQLNGYLKRLNADPDVRARLAREGIEVPIFVSPAEAGKRVSLELDQWRRVIKDGGLTADSP